jgi:hypothetical protein
VTAIKTAAVFAVLRVFSAPDKKIYTHAGKMAVWGAQKPTVA